MASFLPVLVLGGAFMFASRKSRNKKRKKPPEDKKALPPSSEYGNVYAGEEIDIIKAKVGDKFTISVGTNETTGYSWFLSASPPDNSVESLGVDHISDEPAEPMPGSDWTNYLFKFKATKPGSGSIVLHHQQPWMKGKAAPDQVVEIETEISE